MIEKIISNIYNDVKMTFNQMCDRYDQNEIFYDEIMKHKNISDLSYDDFEFIEDCMDAYITKYDNNGMAYKLTKCCNTYSTYHDETLCCKVCWREVESGEGDGTELIKGDK